MAEVSLYLDDRKDKDAAALLKIRVYVDRKTIHHFNTRLPKMERDYYKAAMDPNEAPKTKSLRDLRKDIKQKEDEAKAIVKAIGKPFDPEKFKRLFYGIELKTGAISVWYNDYIEELESEDKAGSADVYRISLKSLTTYWQHINNNKKKVPDLAFTDITPAFLKKYERWYINSGKDKQKQKSHTSIGIYLRCLRAIFNKAINKGEVSRDFYPFGRGKYEIPAGSNIKKALDKDTVKILWSAKVEPDTPADIAKDFWFFSYLCNGMNLKDVANLKFSDLHLNYEKPYFTFRREKTKNTLKKTNLPPIRVPVTDPVKAIIEKHANADSRPGNYVFPIFARGMSAKEQLRIIRNFIKMVNTHITKLAAANGINTKIGTMTARHSFTTQIVQKKGLTFAQEALGHTSHTTTQNYWRGFDHTDKDDAAQSLVTDLL